MQKYLKNRGLMQSTREVYQRVYNSMDCSSPEAVCQWLEDEIGQRQPMGTLLPKKAVAKHVLISEFHLEIEEIERMLPKLKGRSAKQRNSLSEDQYTEYMNACDELSNPARTILKLLPLTGMRIAEICNLTTSNLKPIGNRYILQFRGKGDKERIVPLSTTSWRLLKTYLVDQGYMFEDGSGMMSGSMFETKLGTQVTPHYVRKYTRNIARERPLLNGLSPHILRHTFATRVNRSGIDLKTLQTMLGHSQIQTTSRYLHPTTEDLMKAIDKLEE